MTDLLNPRPADALMAQHARDGWEKLRSLQQEHAITLAKLERMREALRFYENPAAWYSDKRIDPEDRNVPDYYDELDFGSTARAALEDTK